MASASADAIEAETEVEAEDKVEEADADMLLRDELRESLGLTSLSSSLIVSNIFYVLCLITVTYSGGATSMMNLAMLEFANVIYELLKEFGEKRRLKDRNNPTNDVVGGRSEGERLYRNWVGCGCV